MYQRTIRNRAAGSGVGLHSGKTASFAILPSGPDTGITFIHIRGKSRTLIAGDIACVTRTSLSTSLGTKDAAIQTVEHLLAALMGLGIDNARVEVEGDEIPIFDGSAEPFVRIIREAGGTVDQPVPKRVLTVKRVVEVQDGDRLARFEPARGFQIDCWIDYKHPLIRGQRMRVTMNEKTFSDEIARARTFGFRKDVDDMHRRGLALGGTLSNAVLIDDYCVLNPEGLRFADEFVRHKILDVMGDLCLAGHPIRGRYVGKRAGHEMNTRLLQALFCDPRTYTITSEVGAHDTRTSARPARSRRLVPA